MENKFPIVNVVKGALAAPLSHPKSLIKTVVIILASLVIPVLYAVSSGITLDVLRSFSDPSKTEDVMHLAMQVGILYLITIVILAPVAAYLFNYWVRFGAYGPDGAAFPTTGQAVSAALINMLKFILIFILVAIVAVVVSWVLSLIGLAPSFGEQAEMSANDDLRAITLATFFSSIILLIVICIIYSLFSANLTQTALKSDKEGLEHPHTIDFAIVLFLVYLVSFLPGVVAGILNSWWLSIALSATLGTYITLSIAVAHGIRFSLCTSDKPEEDGASEESES